MHTPKHQVQSHQLSLLELGSGTLQEASCLTFDMFLEYPFQRPTTASSASLTPFYVVNLIMLPRTPEEWDEVAARFAKVSRDELFGGSVSAVDGFFQAITGPKVSEVSNQTSYCSGHYENFGLNYQAVCTHDLTFIYVGVVTPGSTNDIIAI